MSATHWTWLLIAVATSAVILRPWRLPEALWAVAGALALVVLQLLAPAQAWAGVRRGDDVYLFLAGMMLLSELARREGVFDWLAALAARRAAGSGQRLFGWVYAVGTLVTVFLSNDATAVVLTPAVFAVARVVGAAPLPYLFVCVYRQRGQFCAADFQPGQPGAVGPPHAVAGAVAGAVCAAIRRIHWCHLRRAALGAA